MKKYRIHKITALLLALLLCFPPFHGVSAEDEGNVSAEVYETHGIEPILPIAGKLDIASIDYYYEGKNDYLPGLHGGVDFICNLNTPILAVYDGVVAQVQSGWSGGYGNNVILEHVDENGEKFYSRYAHLNYYTVRTGARVSQGQVIGYAGSTGQSSTYHLHLEIYNSSKPTHLERSYTTKYLLSLPASELARMSFYYQPINGEYNAQQRQYRLGYGASCNPRCERDDMHDHISEYALYLEKFYNRSPDPGNCRYYFDEKAEAELFADSALRAHVYDRYDTDGDGHLSYPEVMRVTTLDLRGLSIVSLEGIDIFENLSTVLTGEGEIPVAPPDIILPEATVSDETYTLSANYRIDPKYIKDVGMLGLWQHIDDDGELPLRKNPVYNNDYAGAGIPHNGKFIVTEISKDTSNVWGKTTYNGVEGWVIIGNSAWTAQLRSGTEKYSVDAEGYLVSTLTGERITDKLASTETAEKLLDATDIDILTDGKSITAWSYGGRIPAENTKLITLVPELRKGNATVTLDAYFDTVSQPLHELTVELRLPEEGRADFGLLGGWHFSDAVKMRSAATTDSEQVGTVPKGTTVIVTAVNQGEDYLWGLVEYNGASGWCALSDKWAEQITSGYGRYAIDEEGYIIRTDTGERVRAVYASDSAVSELPDLAQMQLIDGFYLFDGWSLDGKSTIPSEAVLSDVFTELKAGDFTATLTAVLSLDPSPDLTVRYRIPTAFVKDAGKLGLWEHIDDDGELPLRKEPSVSADKTGTGIPHLGRFIVTETVTEGANIWGKTTYNGVDGWVNVANGAWTRQITHGVGTYGVDADGYLAYTATGEQVKSELDDELTAAGFFDGGSIDCLTEYAEFTAWKYGDAALTDPDTPLIELFPALGQRKLSVTLTAVIKNNAPVIPPVYVLDVDYYIPSEYTTDAGYIGLWMHTDMTSPLSIRTDHNANTEKIGVVPPLTSFMLSDTYDDGEHLWGKTTYNGVTGWCWIDAEWAEQLTSGTGKYTVDQNGKLVYTATGGFVHSTLEATETAQGLFDGIAIDCIIDGESFYAWKYGDTLITDPNVLLTDIIPELLSGDVAVTLTAVMKDKQTPPDDPTAVHKLNVSYKIPLDAVADAGYLGLWKHTDIEGGLTLRSGHSTSSGKIGSIPPQAEFVVTEFYEGTDFLWGKTTYNGVTGWCALSENWSKQLTSGVGTYTVDAEGYIIYTATGERVSAELDSTAKIADLLDPSLITFMKDELALDGWLADGKYISDSSALLTELIPALAERDVTLTLTARMTGVAGDADGDGDVDERDLDLLVRYLSGYDDRLALANLDLNLDGKINTRDFMLVREMIN